ncbi:MAG: hypothetical protein EOP33_00040 [Rickettsiaceae bacterium]|nr:MAG: hypothetical protein EOP33_00040 [Rickettsiaceae bacterium]
MTIIKMNKFIILTITGLFLLSSCTDGFRGYFKKSANNKWFDRKGLQGGKRKPLYNKKYIDLAKRNIIEENLDDETEADLVIEGANIPSINRQIYVDMVKQDAIDKQNLKSVESKNSKTRKFKNNGYPDLVDAQSKISQAQNKEQNLQQELMEIKSMLIDAKKDLTKYRCPLEDTPKSSRQNKKINENSKLREKFIQD